MQLKTVHSIRLKNKTNFRHCVNFLNVHLLNVHLFISVRVLLQMAPWRNDAGPDLNTVF